MVHDIAPTALRSPTRYLVWLARRDGSAMVLGICWGLGALCAQALVPATVGLAVQAGIIGGDRLVLVTLSAVVLVLGLIQATAGILTDRRAVASALAAIYSTARLIGRQASRLGTSLPDKTSVTEVVGVAVADIPSLGAALSVAGRGVGAIAAIAVVAGILLGMSWQLGLVVVLGMPVMVLVSNWLIRSLHRRQRLLRDCQGELTGQAIDVVGGSRVLHGIGGQAVVAERYRAKSGRVRAAAVRVARVESAFGAVKVLLPGLLVAFSAWIGSRQTLAGQLDAGQLVACYGYAIFLVVPLHTLADAADKITKGHVAARRITRFLMLVPDHSDRRGDIEGDGQLADPVSGIAVPPASFIAVTCADPADAEALARRLAGLGPSTACYNEVPVNDLPMAELRRRILLVDGDTYLFSGRLRDELDSQGNRDDRLLANAIRAASAEDIVEGLPGGLDEVITAAAMEFSGGQRQRLHLTRAIMADPAVLILLDPASAVDAHTEMRIARGLAAHRHDRQTLVFSTSPILLGQADCVNYVERMRVVAQGTHDDLLTNPRYRAVVAPQDEQE